MQTVTITAIEPLTLLARGKVRDIYEVDDEHLLLVTTDRLSAFDVVLPDAIPLKGAVLNSITIFWMEFFADLVANHLVATDVRDFPAMLQPFADQLAGRSVIVRRASPLPVECIVRGFITGSGWQDYQRTGSISGHRLPEGLLESDMLSTPIFTPSTKAEVGDHDENITVERARELVGDERMQRVEALSLGIYTRAREYAREKSILIADTKFEFGTIGDQLVLIDEVLTPDSSRFWPLDNYATGRAQQSFDKQVVRDYLTGIGFNKQPPGPRLPAELIEQTSKRYLEIHELLTGTKLAV